MIEYALIIATICFVLSKYLFFSLYFLCIYHFNR